MENSKKSAKTFPGAYCDSDHNLLMVKLCLKFKSNKRKHTEPLLNLELLNNPEIHTSIKWK